MHPSTVVPAENVPPEGATVTLDTAMLENMLPSGEGPFTFIIVV